jgi:hypothetical protein
MRTIQYDYIAQIKDSSNTEFAFLLAEDLKQAIRDNHCEAGRRLKQERRLEGGTLIGFQVMEPTVKAARCVGETSDRCVQVIGDVDYAINEKPGKTSSEDLKDLINKIVKEYRDANVVRTSVPTAGNELSEDNNSTNNNTAIIAIIFGVIGLLMIIIGFIFIVRRRNSPNTSAPPETKESASHGTESDDGHSTVGNLEGSPSRAFVTGSTTGGNPKDECDASTVIVNNAKEKDQSKFVDVEM